jgi:hypothetical protein
MGLVGRCRRKPEATRPSISRLALGCRFRVLARDASTMPQSGVAEQLQYLRPGVNPCEVGYGGCDAIPWLVVQQD